MAMILSDQLRIQKKLEDALEELDCESFGCNGELIMGDPIDIGTHCSKGRCQYEQHIRFLRGQLAKYTK
jgi:hypothetical protein